MKKILLLVICVVLGGCAKSDKPSSSTDTAKAPAPAPAPAPPDQSEAVLMDDADYVSATIKSLSPQGRDSLLELIKKNFIYSKDEFKEVGFYKHKNWGNNTPMRTCMNAYVNTIPTVYLRSNFVGDSWLFHEQAKLSIDGKIIGTDVIRSSDAIRETIGGGDVFESNTYIMNYDVVKAIADNVDKTIKVRLEGDKYYRDFTIPDKDKKAIQDCWVLWQLLFLKKG